MGTATTMATLAMSAADKAATDRFKTDVFDKSATALVIVDFWAEWCAPCKALTPTLEKVAAAYADKGVVLAKVNVDEDKFIAAQFQIRTIPTVYAVFEGQIVADLTPARTEGQLNGALDSILAQIGPLSGDGAPDIEPLLAMGVQVLDGGDAERAVSIFSQIVEMAPDDPRAHAGEVEALMAAGRDDDARARIDALPNAIAKDPALSALGSRLAITGSAVDAGEVAALRERIAADAGDHEAHLALAGHEMASGERDAAADRLLASIAADRDWNDGAARAKFLQLLEAEGLTDPWASAQRRRLSDILFG